MKRIYLVEDDAIIANAISSHLSQWGYQVETAQAFDDVLTPCLSFDPHLVLLDISLPHFNGFHWCEMIRRHSRVPIIFISSAADQMNIVMAVNLGADDFIAKPFSLHVLTAKVQAILRRTYDFQTELTTLSRGDVLLHLGRAAVQYHDQTVDLTRNEFMILQILMENAGHVVSREEVITHLWEDDSFIDDNTLTVNVNRLRKKLEAAGLQDFILTKKGLGYFIP